MEYAKKSLDSIDTKQKDLSNLIDQIEKNIEAYKEKPGKIESVCFFACFLKIRIAELINFYIFIFSELQLCRQFEHRFKTRRTRRDHA